VWQFVVVGRFTEKTLACSVGKIIVAPLKSICMQMPFRFINQGKASNHSIAMLCRRNFMLWMQEFEKMLFPLCLDEINIKGAFMLKHQNLPSSIFKYREITSFSLKNLGDDTVWLADPTSFNDPYDSCFAIDFSTVSNKFYQGQQIDDLLLSLSESDKTLSLTEIETIKTSQNPTRAMAEAILKDADKVERDLLLNALSEITEKMHSELLDNFKSTIRDSFKICSFSADVGSALMWSHYTKNHTGFCIEYDLTSIPYGDFRTRFLYPVIYSDKLFDATKWMETTPNSQFNNLYMKYAALHKSNEWAYEKEWRLLFSAGVMEKQQSYPMGKPKALYLGAMISKEDQGKIVDIAKNKGINVFKMELHNQHFRLLPKLLDSSGGILKNE
jgi:hypothetical protein